MAQMARHKTEKYLVPLSCVHNDDIKDLLDEKKLKHTECMMLLTSLLVNDGFLSRISAAIPATNGVAAEVPSKIFV